MTEEVKKAQAMLKNIKVSPQKLNLVAGAIRGKHVSEALGFLSHSRKRCAYDVRKTLMSAIANAENNHDMDVDSLHIAEAYVGKSMVLKRFRARAKGRGARILKPFSRLTIELVEKEV